MPGDQGYFIVEQNDEVRAFGSEQLVRYFRKIGKLANQLSLTYNFTRSIAADKWDWSGNQQIFVPVHTGAIALQSQWKSLQFAYFHNFTSERYLDNNHDDHLDGYHTGDFSMAYDYKNWNLSLNFRNIWGHEYVVLPQRPMPRQSFDFILQYYINRTKSNNEKTN